MFERLDALKFRKDTLLGYFFRRSEEEIMSEN